MLSRFFVAALAVAMLAPLAKAEVAKPDAAKSEIVLPAGGLVVEIGATTYSIPRLSIEGGGLTGADLARLVDPKDPAPLDARLAKLTAARVVIPEIRGESKAGGRETRIVYRDVALENLVAGKIGALRAASLEQEAKSSSEKPAGGAITARYANLVAKGVDLRQLAHVLTAPRAGDAEPATAIEDETTIETATIAFPDAGVEVRAGPVAALGLRGRALAEPPLAPKGDAGTPEQAAQLALKALGALELGAFGARDVVVTGRGAGDEKPYSLKFGRLALDRLAGAKAREATIDDFALDSGDGGHVAARHLALRGLDFNALLTAGEARAGGSTAPTRRISSPICPTPARRGASNSR